MDEAKAQPSGNRLASRLRQPAFAVAVVFAALAIRFFYLIWKYSADIFFSDQWDFLGLFFRGQASIRNLFLLQHGPHREGIGLLANKVLYPLTRWDARTDSFLIGVCLLAAALLALWLKRKLFGPLTFTDAVIPCIFLGFSQYEALTVTPNPSYGGFPVLLIVSCCLALLVRRRALRYALVLPLNFLVIYTSFGIFFAPLIALAFLLESIRSWRDGGARAMAAPLGGFAVCIASFASYFVSYTFVTAVDCTGDPIRHYYEYPWFMSLMFSTYLGWKGKVVSTVVGVAALAGAIWIALGAARKVLRDDDAQPRRLIVLMLLGYSLLFAAATAAGRTCLGIYAAQASRYGTLIIPAALGFYFWTLSRSSPKRRRWLAALCIVLVLPGAVFVPGGTKLYAERKRAWADCYRRVGSVEACDASTGSNVFPYPARTHLREKLEFLREHRLNLFAGE
jgi:hypothetical protein